MIQGSIMGERSNSGNLKVLPLQIIPCQWVSESAEGASRFALHFLNTKCKHWSQEGWQTQWTVLRAHRQRPLKKNKQLYSPQRMVLNQVTKSHARKLLTWVKRNCESWGDFCLSLLQYWSPSCQNSTTPHKLNSTTHTLSNAVYTLLKKATELWQVAILSQ